mmetsp:Transcript_88286/g.184495  ORF Transcript_88286/g.184495 Transcript_88286/m.184495 type:complete len:334 (-) Transcript_88286:207-1208(-)
MGPEAVGRKLLPQLEHPLQGVVAADAGGEASVSDDVGSHATPLDFAPDLHGQLHVSGRGACHQDAGEVADIRVELEAVHAVDQLNALVVVASSAARREAGAERDGPEGNALLLHFGQDLASHLRISPEAVSVHSRCVSHLIRLLAGVEHLLEELADLAGLAGAPQHREHRVVGEDRRRLGQGAEELPGRGFLEALGHSQERRESELDGRVLDGLQELDGLVALAGLAEGKQLVHHLLLLRLERSHRGESCEHAFALVHVLHAILLLAGHGFQTLSLLRPTNSGPSDASNRLLGWHQKGGLACSSRQEGPAGAPHKLTQGHRHRHVLGGASLSL